MERTWYWRLGLVLAVLFWSLWQLVPTWAYFRLPPEERNGPAYEKSVPGWAPDAKKHLNLGLDLRWRNLHQRRSQGRTTQDIG